MPPREIQTAREMLRSVRHVVVFTGAGMSAESGIPTFRDPGGIWDQFPPERFATLTGLTGVYRHAPDDLRRFLHTGLHTLVGAKPNPGHTAIAALADRTKVTVVTQNIDGLHQRAGSRTVHELHGSMHELRCTACSQRRRIPSSQLADIVAQFAGSLPSRLPHRRLLRGIRRIIPRCPDCRARMRPSVVLFEEMLPMCTWQAAENAAAACDLMLIIGTSATVQPAAMLPLQARNHGARIIVVNKDPAARLSWADVNLTASAASVLPEVIDGDP